MSRLLSTVALPVLLLVSLSGCFGAGSSDDKFDYVPGKYKETGKTVELKATVIDIVRQEVVPGLQVNLWAFCFAAADPEDTYSVNAIEAPEQLQGDYEIPAEFTSAGYKCGVPGPTLRVHQGDRVIVDFAHTHFHPHTIHWHGQHVPYLMDGVPGATQDPVKGGTSYKYEFIAAREGTLWYHCHVDTQLHVMQGLYGMMIVEPQETKYEPKDIEAEFDLVFSSMRRANVEAIGPLHSHPPGCASGFVDDGMGNPCENPPTDVTPDVFLLNGHSYPLTEQDPSVAWSLTEGKRYRIRMLNAGVEEEQIHFHGHDVLVTHFDGAPLESPYYADTVVLAPANRIDVVLVADNPGVWVYHTHVNNHETNCGKAAGGMHSSFTVGDHSHDHEFMSELPASCATPRTILPGDFSDSAVFTLPMGEAAPASWEFPLELICGVKELRVEIELDPENAALQAVTQVDVTVRNPNDLAVATFTLGGTTGGPFAEDGYDGKLSGEYRLVRAQITEGVQGNYTISYGTPGDNGQAAGSTLRFDVLVDYHSTLDATKLQHQLYGTPACPGAS